MSQTLLRVCFGVLIWGVLAAGVSGLPSFLCRKRLTLCMVVTLSSLGYSSTPVCTFNILVQTHATDLSRQYSSPWPSPALLDRSGKVWGYVCSLNGRSLRLKPLSAFHHGQPGGRHDAVQWRLMCVAGMLGAVTPWNHTALHHSPLNFHPHTETLSLRGVTSADSARTWPVARRVSM